MRIQELVNLIEVQKAKLFDIFTRLFPKQKKVLELLKNLIIVHLEYIEASKQKLPSVKLRRQRDRLRDELENKLGDDLVEEIQSVLDDCEEIVEEVKKITENKEGKISKLIQRETISCQQIQQFKREENGSIIAEINKLQGKLEVREEEI
ncbi:17909_t:CDS:2, partial [Cetraspora pellucida]